MATTDDYETRIKAIEEERQQLEAKIAELKKQKKETEDAKPVRHGEIEGIIRKVIGATNTDVYRMTEPSTFYTCGGLGCTPIEPFEPVKRFPDMRPQPSNDEDNKVTRESVINNYKQKKEENRKPVVIDEGDYAEYKSGMSIEDVVASTIEKMEAKLASGTLDAKRAEEYKSKILQVKQAQAALQAKKALV